MEVVQSKMKASFASLALGLLALVAGCASVPTLTDRTSLDSFVGRKVRIVGEVSNSKVPAILGIEVEADSPDLRGQIAEAEGVLERYELTREELDKQWRETGPFQSSGPGVFYYLRDPFRHGPAKAKRPAPSAAPASALAPERNGS